MTDKKIIDGVDVNECCFYQEKYCTASHITCSYCYDYQNCYYKQLKRKEKECERMKEEKLDRQNALTEMINILYPNADDDELFTAVFNSEYIDKLKEVVEQLKSKEQECEKLRFPMKDINYAILTKEEFENFDQLKAEVELLRQYKGSKQASYETMQREWNEAKNEVKKLKTEKEELKKQACGLRPEIKYIINEICCKYNINAKYYHEKIVEIINNLDQLKQVLQEIKKIAQYNVYTPHTDLCIKLNWVKKKISEVENADKTRK